MWKARRVAQGTRPGTGRYTTGYPAIIFFPIFVNKYIGHLTVSMGAARLPFGAPADRTAAYNQQFLIETWNRKYFVKHSSLNYGVSSPNATDDRKGVAGYRQGAGLDDSSHGARIHVGCTRSTPGQDTNDLLKGTFNPFKFKIYISTGHHPGTVGYVT